MSSERRASQPRGHVEQRSANSGGGLLGTVLTLVGIPVGWFASVVAAMVALTYLISSDMPSLVAGIGPTTTFYVAVAVLVVFALFTIVRPGTVFFGWLLMGVIVAVAATFFLGWSTLLLIFEGLTVVFLIYANFWLLVADAPDGFLAALALERKLR
ncbi:MAG TPA: hypothetical protein VFJ06_01690 [Halococcus sp.]|nr:hypothetical protein [Halococcus sp.]